MGFRFGIVSPDDSDSKSLKKPICGLVSNCAVALRKPTAAASLVRQNKRGWVRRQGKSCVTTGMTETNPTVIKLMLVNHRVCVK